MQAYERQHYDTVRALTPDCLVLLKSDGSFPLAGPEPIAAVRQRRALHRQGPAAAPRCERAALPDH